MVDNKDIRLAFARMRNACAMQSRHSMIRAPALARSTIYPLENNAAMSCSIPHQDAQPPHDSVGDNATSRLGWGQRLLADGQGGAFFERRGVGHDAQLDLASLRTRMG